MRKNMEYLKDFNITHFTILFFLFILSSFFSCENLLVLKFLDPKTAAFETNGGNYIEKQIVYRDYPVKRPSNPVKSGYIFDAWYIDDETFRQKWDFDTIPNADITLFANWISSGGTDDPGDDDDPSDPDDDPSDPDDDPEPEDGHIVTFVYGNGIENKTRKISNGGLLITPTAPTRKYTPTQGLYLNPIPEEYTIDGWYRDSVLTDKWDLSTDTVDGNITLYAKWTSPNSITLNTGTSNLILEAIKHVNNNAAANTSYTLLLIDIEITAPGSNAIPIITNQYFNLIIKGISGSVIRQAGSENSSLFSLNADNAKLTLGENITLQGLSYGTASLVTVTRGTLVMESGSAITGHTNTSADGGGGVKVNGGTFIMNGGTISKNTATYGGGVYIGSGTFNMNGGIIRDNNAIKNGNGDGGIGGGVNVGSGTFNMNSGTISGNKADSAGGVYTNGTFNMNGGIISGNEATGSSGGGVYVGNTGAFRISNGTVYGNESTTAQNLRNNVPTGEVGAALYVSKGGDNSGGAAKYGSGLDITLILDSVPALGGYNYFGYTDDTITGQ